MIAHICLHIIMLYRVYLPVLCVVYACVYLSIMVRTLVYSHYLHVFSTDHVVVTSALRLFLFTTRTLVLPCLSYFSFTVMIAIKSYKANTAWVKRKHSEHLLFCLKSKVQSYIRSVYSCPGVIHWETEQFQPATQHTTAIIYVVCTILSLMTSFAHVH